MKTETLPPHLQLAIMSREYVVSRAIHAVAQLGIADHMSDQAISVNELAKLTSTVPELLDRVLCFLSDYGLFTKNESGYALTPLSSPLRRDHPSSMKEVLGMVDESWWQAFSHLATELQTGKPAFKHQHGIDYFSFLKQNPDKKNRFEQGMAKLSSFDDQAIAQGFNFGQFNTLTDVGYGRDGLSKAISNQYPDVGIIPFKFNPELIEKPNDTSFASLPSVDAYLFKGILHDFNDELIKKILINCRNKMNQTSSIIIAEQVIPENNLPHTNKTMDIIMMVLVGGRQRTLNNWCELIESIGFKLTQTVPLQGLFTIMEFK